MKKYFSAAALVLGLVLAYASPGAQERVFTVKGTAAISGDNYSQAKAQGLIDAYKNALTRALTQSLGEKTVKEKFKLLDEQFFKDPGRFVNRYKLLSEQFLGDSYNVNAEVELDLDKIRIDLVQIGLDKPGRESIILAVVEKENDAYQSAWLAASPSQSYPEKLLGMEMQRWGYRLVRPAPIFDPEKIDKNLGDKIWLFQLKDRYNADFLILGEEKLIVEKKEEPAQPKRGIQTSEESGAGLYAANSELMINLVNLESGEKQLIQKSAVSALDPELNEAKAKATAQAVRSILPDLSLGLERLSRRGQEKLSGQKVPAEILGVNSYFKYQQLMDGLKKMEGLSSVELWGFAPGVVKVVIQYPGDRESLKKAISESHFPLFKLLPVESERQDFSFKFEALK